MNIASIIVVHPLDGNAPYNAARINTINGPIDMPLTPEQASLLVEVSQLATAPSKQSTMSNDASFRASNSASHWEDDLENSDTSPDYPNLEDDPIYLREASNIVNAYGDDDDDDI